MNILKLPVPGGPAFDDGNAADKPEVNKLVEQLVDRYKAVALEQGWSAPEEDAGDGVRSALDAARAELVLLERRANGDWGVSLDARQDQLRDALRLRAAMPEPTAAVSPFDGAEHVRSWRFDWRRCLAFALAAMVTAFVFAHAGRAGLFASLGCLALLCMLGPWGLARRLATGAAAGLRAFGRLREIEKLWRLESEIARIEQLVVVAALRKARAEIWVEQRLDLVRHQMEIQRARAEKAAKIVAMQHGNRKEEAERELSSHHSSQRVR